jgi:hypothetical protein
MPIKNVKIEQMISSILVIKNRITENIETLGAIKIKEGNPQNVGDFRTAMTKMAEANEALAVAKTHLNNLLSR